MDHVWVTRTADGEELFTSKRKAMRRLEELWPGGKWEEDEDGNYEYLNDDIDEAWVAKRIVN